MLTSDKLSLLINEEGPDVAFDKLYEDYEIYIRRNISFLFKASSCSNREIHCEEVISDVWTSLKLKIISLFYRRSKEIKEIKPYLKTTAKNCCTKHFFKCTDDLKNFLNIEVPEILSVLPNIEAKAESDIIKKELLKLVLLCLMEMPEKEKEVLILAVAGTSHEEAARKLNVTEKASKVARFRAKKKLKNLLEKRGYQ